MINKFLAFVFTQYYLRYRLETILFNKDGEDQRIMLNPEGTSDKQIEKFKKFVCKNIYSAKPLDIHETLVYYTDEKNPNLYCAAYLLKHMLGNGLLRIIPAKMIFTDSMEVIQCLKDNRELFNFSGEASIDDVRGAAAKFTELAKPLEEKKVLEKQISKTALDEIRTSKNKI